ncbi:MAG TPA: glycosyltransferase [Thermoanaerobaculia bacterium]|nr:glycosyltransferase [Thermoanaerobaculia bacterium]
MKISIGVHVHAQPSRLEATLASIARHTQREHELIVIPDGADFSVRAAARVLPDDGPRGGAACLNKLAKNTTADVVVLLESGALVAPRWLDHLLAALESTPRAGLAGPSTNGSWNEQGVFANAAESELERTGAEAEQQFGTLVRTLAPLYSLGDFCYAVKREVFEAIGGADEAYGLGPCWEMDFNARAARAGFDGLWACAAYVWRAPFTSRRAREETARFDGNRRRYQDKFCGARLRGQKHDYRQHCRGDACPNFAPREVAPLPVTSGDPLVSCIMPTFDRRAFLPAAIRCFLGQDYPNLELIVVDDGTDPIADLLPSDSRVVYMRLPARKSVGAKRNLACERARGEFIVHWDDDDWYPSSRVRVQVEALRQRGADVCGSSVVYYLDRDRQRAYSYRYSGSPVAWVAGNTLAYRRDAWARNRFSDIQVGEDSQFVWRFPAQRVVDLRDPSLCVGTLHDGNVSPKDTRGAFWSPENADRILQVMQGGGSASPPHTQPLLSCIMPTYNRRRFIPLALERFREQSYPNRELIIVDDGTDPIGDLVRHEPAVRYIRLDRRTSIGGKRNLACAEARGEIVAHWDDDDWYSRDRLMRQAAPIVRGEADITGLENRFILQMPMGRFWTTDRRLHRTMFVCDVHGGTLVFRRSLWTAGLRYPEINLAEDAIFVRNAVQRGRRLIRLDNEGSFVYVRHGTNAWRFETGTFLDPNGWSETTPPPGFTPACLNAYLATVRGTG